MTLLAVTTLVVLVSLSVQLGLCLGVCLMAELIVRVCYLSATYVCARRLDDISGHVIASPASRILIRDTR